MIPQHAKRILEDIKELGYKPTSRESGLFRSIRILIKGGQIITDKQGDWLILIYEKAFHRNRKITELKKERNTE